MNTKDQWIQILFGPLFKIIGFFYRSYKLNRQRVKTLKQRPGFAKIVKAGMLLTIVVWLGIWFFATEESRNSLTEQVRQSLDGVLGSKE